MDFDLDSYINSLSQRPGSDENMDDHEIPNVPDTTGYFNNDNDRQVQPHSDDEFLSFINFPKVPSTPTADTTPTAEATATATHAAAVSETPNPARVPHSLLNAMLQHTPEALADGSVSAFEYLSLVLGEVVQYPTDNNIDPALLMPPPSVPMAINLNSLQQVAFQQQGPAQPQFYVQEPAAEYHYNWNALPARGAAGSTTLDSASMDAIGNSSLVGMNMDGFNQTPAELYWGKSPSPTFTELYTPSPPAEGEVVQLERRLNEPRLSKTKGQTKGTQERKKGSKPAGPTGARRVRKAKSRAPKVFPLATRILKHELFPYLTSEDIGRIQTRIGGKQLKELNILLAERDGKHFPVPAYLACSKCARFGYTCLLSRIVDYGRHAEATIGHCKGCTGNSDGCTFFKRPEERLAAYSAYYDGQTFAVFGKIGKGTQVFPYASMNKFTRQNAIIDPTVRRAPEDE
ncbi:hypothetical protein CspeluHIS016_0901220 [Cutaneotrichosporon spelunceum]|uniref:Uncharacterized protein n=1 Tax=Cutaneotrichosporon spelunceum TaxID=1672016 RepID=A0AAD3U0E1_9TREE|nr:hypothetical protein CspeluHIS016_0901220 [Cutaneotrichosporon spelunceum]